MATRTYTDPSLGTSAWGSSNHSTGHANTSSGSSIDPKIVALATKNGATVNVVTAINTATGKTETHTGVVIAGVTYNSSGQRIVSGGNSSQQGVIPGKDDISLDSSGSVHKTTVWYSQPEPTPAPTPTPVRNDPTPVYYDPEPYYSEPSPPPEPYIPPAPVVPAYETFSVPAPTFSSDLQRVHKFTYFFGVDKIEVKSLELNSNCCRITKDIEVGNADFIEVEAVHNEGVETSIEYSLLDGDEEIPILPNNTMLVSNEKIFYGLPLRFEVDTTKEVVIKKNGIITSISFEEANQKSDGIYTATYYAKSGVRHAPKNSSIRMKFVLRLYDKSAEPPYIKNVNLKLIGGDTVWQEIT